MIFFHKSYYNNSMETEKKEKRKKFTQGYIFKIIILFGFILILLLPMTCMIRGIIYERNETAYSAEKGIMEAWGSELIAAGPFVVIPGIRTEQNITKTERDGEKIEIIERPFNLVLTPDKLDIRSNFKTEVRKRGIFSVPLFSGEMVFSGTFNPETALSSLLHNEKVYFNQVELIIVLDSQKGIRGIDKALWNDNALGQDWELFFQPGNRGLSLSGVFADSSPYKSNYINSGIYAAVPYFANSEMTFDIGISIQGGQLARFLPIGQDSHIEIYADWASPSFQGAFLPGSMNITDKGFDAAWDISYLSRDIPLFWKNDGLELSRHGFTDSFFGVDFFRAIDTYSLNTRAVKYAILFLVVPFLTLFLLEIFTKKKIHPVPYLLSGIANIIFYLLLLSLSEQIYFYLAYLTASVSVTVLLTLYSRSLLSSWNKSWYMGLTSAFSYVLLYAVLNSESYALLIGSVMAFAVIALVMFLTRRLDWYGSDL